MSQAHLGNPVAVFDIGNVVVSLDNESRDRFIGRHREDHRNVSHYDSVSKDILKNFRTGKITERQYLIQMGRSLGVDPAVVLEAEMMLLKSLNKALVEKIYELKKIARVVCLSNNQEIHWRALEQRILPTGLFDKCYLSHHIGLDKPDPNIFDYVTRSEQVDPGSLVLIDDDVLNVEAAILAGWIRSFVHKENESTFAEIGRIWAYQ